MKKRLISAMVIGMMLCTGCSGNILKNSGVDIPVFEMAEGVSTPIVTSEIPQAQLMPLSYADDHQTAPMPDRVVSEDEIIGFYSPDPDELEPAIIQFYKEKGVLKYRYFKLLLGNGSGIGIATKKRTVFEFNAGDVIFNTNQGRCSCISGDGAVTYISFYCFDMTMETIVNQDNGETFYRLHDFVMPK